MNTLMGGDQIGSTCPLSGLGVALRYQGSLQNHNMRHDFFPREFGKRRAYIIWCTASRPLEKPFTEICERTNQKQAD